MSAHRYDVLIRTNVYLFSATQRQPLAPDPWPPWCANLFGVRKGIDAFGVRKGIDAIGGILMNDPMALVRPIAIFGVTFAVGWLVRRLVLRTLRLWADRSESRAGLIWEQALRGPLWMDSDSGLQFCRSVFRSSPARNLACPDRPV